jgi:RHS repeat-associated protein
VSGNVREVVYQKGAADEFHHKYHYDADNRITNVFTSADGIIYEQDAKYFYYDHGPLARVELGHEKVQAQDYAYTIQGWLKTVNGEQIDPQTMMGADGINSLNKQVARDVYGYSLNYFDGDYTSSNTSMLNHSVTAQTASMGQSLYNGNIRTMFTALSPTTLNQDNEVLNTHQTNYTYDQLNRIKSMTGYDRQVGQAATPSNYSSSYSYDPNGNLTDLQRWAKINDVSTQIDQLAYHYNDPVNGGNNNRLSYVTDASGEVMTGVDLASQSTDNYSYDAIGQLIQDNAEHIEEIKWTVTGKVKEILYDPEYLEKHIEFMYNPMGNRIGKVVTTNGDVTKTFYTLDAQGNSMAIYTLKTEDSQKNLYLSERNIYGSSRLGMENVNYLIASSNATNIEAYAHENVVVGDKAFELSNHLGNVLNVVTDRKIPEFDATTGDLAFFNAVVVGYSDYYPFGMQRISGGTLGRYGFNGYEKDDEVKGAGNSLDFGARIYDPRVARFLSLDPRLKDFPFWSPYIFASNNPTRMIDINGEGPGDRIKAAASFLGTAYKQENDSKLRTGSSTEALKKMDCSELVCRVLAADGITSGVKHMNTTGLITFLGQSDKFHKSQSPQSGDIVLWKGHTGVVESYDSKKKKVTVLHATSYKNKDGTKVESVVREVYSLSYFEGKGASFYRPIEESSDKGSGGEFISSIMKNLDDFVVKSLDKAKSFISDLIDELNPSNMNKGSIIPNTNPTPVSSNESLEGNYANEIIRMPVLTPNISVTYDKSIKDK